jgi:peptidoglycan hydrolase-like protein with peptidoglycan-binding domain
MKYTHSILLLTILLSGVSINAQTSNSNDSNQTTKAVAKTSKKSRQKTFRPSKSQITKSQQILRSGGIYSGPITGKYNDDFRSALDKFQDSNGLPKTGKVDKPTLVKMKIGLTDKQKGIKRVSKRRKTFRANKEQISAVQTMFKSQGKYSGEVNGKYSKSLRSTIKEFQSSNALKRKGNLNRATLEKLGIELTVDQRNIPVNPGDLASASGKSGRSRKPVFRATKDQIKQVQAMLNRKGLYTGGETGKLSTETRNAIRLWQTQNGIKKTGTLNKTTLEAMKIVLTEKQRSY